MNDQAADTHAELLAELERLHDDANCNLDRISGKWKTEADWERERHDVMRVSMKAATALRTQAEELRRAREERDEAQKRLFVPGRYRCAKCKMVLHSKILHVNAGVVTANDASTEPCPNGCGPLWRMTWQQDAEDAHQGIERIWHEREAETKRAESAEASLAAVRREVERKDVALKQAATWLRNGDYDNRGGLIEMDRLAGVCEAALAATPTPEGQ